MATGGMHGQRGKALLLELKRSDFLPAYNEEGVRETLGETKALWGGLVEVLESPAYDPTDTAVGCGLLVQQQSVLRNKRCLLAYFNARLEKIEEMRHEHGTVLPPDVRPRLSAHESDYFKGYSRLLEKYMEVMDIDITADLQPPKDLMVEVRVLKDCGEIFTTTGTVTLKKDERVLLRRTDVEPLIRQGLCEQTTGR